MAKQINANAYITDSDLKTQCPNCFTDTTGVIGSISVGSGVNHPVYKCTSCNTAYTKPAEGGMQVLVDAVAAEYDGEAAFTPASTIQALDNSAPAQAFISGPVNAELDYNTQQTIENLCRNVENLMMKLDTLATQNQELMTQLATDPLIETKKRVNKFNLE